MKDLIISVLLCVFLTTISYCQSSNWQSITKHQDRFEFSLDKDKLMSQISEVALYSKEGLSRAETKVVNLPRPDGTSEDYDVYQTTVMHPDLAVKYPTIKTFIGISKDSPGRQIRFSISHKQFAGYIMDPVEEPIFISHVENDLYQAYAKSDYKRVGSANTTFSCGVKSHNENEGELSPDSQLKTPRGDINLRTYRLALACTGEYATFHGGNKPDVLDAMVIAMVRVNGIYERDLGITMVLIPNNDEIIYLNGQTDPYTNNNGGTMLGQNQSTLDNVIGTANYDIGHVFSTGGGGIASLNSPCNPNRKARGVTGLGSPVGDPFYVDYVAHEMGHQFGGNHTQNNDCQRNISTAMEPGSASTIMGYAGICNPNVQNNSDDYFHAISLQEMTIYSTDGNGNSCAVITDTGNSQVDVSVSGSNYTLPIDTPFRLIAEGTDPDVDDVLTYCWEQMDNEAATMPPSPANIGGPAFRTFDPTENPIRYFPRIQSILNNSSPTWEVLPIVTRNMDFRCTVRDNSPLNGTIADADVSLSFTDQAGPFRVTTQNTAEEWVAFSTEIVEWDVAGTDQAPVSCSQVDILMSLDGGLNYDVIVATNLENDGSADIEVPNVESENARIMLVCSDNVFFDINNTNLTVRSTQFLLSPNPSTVSSCDEDVVSTVIDYSPVGNFNEMISLSVEGLPDNAMASFSEDEISSAGMVTLEFSGLNNVEPGIYNITLVGNGETESYQTIMILEVYTSNVAAPIQNEPSNGDKGVDARPAFAWELDGNVSEYTLQLSTNPAFPDMETFTFEDFNSGNLITQDLEAGTVYYWRLLASNPCATDDEVSGTFSFQTGGEVCESYDALTNNLPILSTGPNEVRSLLSVTNNVSISRMTASVDIAHDNVGDLVLDVLSPSSGPSITMMNRPGVPATTIGCTGNDIDIKFDDQAVLTADDLENGCQNTTPAIVGNYQSIEPLSNFTGLNSLGIWILEVNDFRTGGGGVMNNWSLEICSLQDLAGEVILTNVGVNVSANSNVIISAMELNVSDVNPEQVVYTLLEVTQHGDLTLDDGTGNLSVLKIGSTFTQTDLDNSLINYASGDGSETADAFVFDVVNSEGFWSPGNQFDINIVSALSASVELTSGISCFGASDGILTVNAVGGSPEYTYSIDGITFQDSPIFEGLGASEYTFVVMDSDGSLFETGIELSEPLEIFVDVDQAGYTITIIAEQGIEPYMYSLDGINFQSDPVFQVPGEGDYTAIVVDANGCMKSNEFFVMASSVNDLNNKLNVAISPNPGSGLYTMMFNTDQRLNISMRVFDATGRELYKVQMDVNDQLSKVLDLTSFSNGTYVIFLEDADGYSSSYQLIKN